ncbi:MAG: FecR family protein [Bacteroidota bacterium]
MEEQYNSPFLARWLADELSEEELREFQQTDAYKQYIEIIEALDTAEFSDYDMNTNYAATLEKVKSEKAKQDKAIPNKKNYIRLVYAMAATLVIYFGYTFFLQETRFTTELAEAKTFELPDGSTVSLNSGSMLQFKTFNWKNKRKLNLEGEAFFKVKSGEPFSVHTKSAVVRVLGTAFKVNSRDNLYEVTCFDGDVEVVTKGQDTTVLTKGKALMVQDGKLRLFNTDRDQPDWLQNESSFNNVHILEVINELERQFDLKIEGKENLKSAYYSGRFKHNDVQSAVKVVFETMNIPYIFNNQKKLIIKEY